MSLEAIVEVLAALAPADPVAPPLPDLPTQQRFAEMLKTPERISSPSGMLTLQGEVSEMLVATDLAAKVAGAVTQGVNKLVNAG